MWWCVLISPGVTRQPRALSVSGRLRLAARPADRVDHAARDRDPAARDLLARHRHQQLASRTSKSVTGHRLPLAGDPFVAAQHLVELRQPQLAVADDGLAGDDGVPRAHRPAAQPRLDRVGPRAGERDALERPHGDVAAGAGREEAVVRRRGRGTAPSRASPARARRARSSTRARAGSGRAAAPCAPRATSSRVPTRRRRTRGRRRSPARRISPTGVTPCGDEAARRRAVRHADAPAGEPGDLLVGDEDAVRHPRARRAPADALEPVDLAHAEVRRGTTPPRRRTARGASSMRTSWRSASSAAASISPGWRPSSADGPATIRVIAVRRAVVVGVDQPLGVGDDRVGVLDELRRGRSAHRRGRARRRRGRIEAQADLARRRDLGVDQLRPRVRVEVVGRVRAASERQLGERRSTPRRTRLLVERTHIVAARLRPRRAALC